MRRAFVAAFAAAVACLCAKAGSVVSFNGYGNQYVSAGRSLALGPDTTMAGWVKNPLQGSQGWDVYYYGVLFGQGGIGTGAGMVIYVVNASGVLSLEGQVRQSDPAYTASFDFATSPLGDASAWHHVVFSASRTNGRLRIYVDGLLAASYDGTLPDYYSGANQNFTIGENSFGSYPVNCRMADVAVWNRELGAGEVAELYLHRVDPADDDLAAYWPLDEGSGDTARNAVSGGGAQADGIVGTDWVDDGDFAIPSYADWMAQQGGEELGISARQPVAERVNTLKLRFDLTGVDGEDADVYAVFSARGSSVSTSRKIATCDESGVFSAELYGLLPDRAYDIKLRVECGGEAAESATVGAVTLPYSSSASGDERTISIAGVDDGALGRTVHLAFGPGDSDGVLYAVYGPAPGGDGIASWSRRSRIASIDSATATYDYAVPQSAGWGEDAFATRFYLCEEVAKSYDSLREYILSDCSGTQYVNTGYFPNPSTALEMSVQFSERGSGGNSIFFGTAEPENPGSNNWISYVLNFAEHSDDSIYAWFGYYYAHGQNDDFRSIGSGMRAVASQRNTLRVANGLLEWGVCRLAIHEKTIAHTLNPLYLFGSIDGYGNIAPFDYSAMKLYSARITENDILLHDYRPAVKDGRAGLYDAATGAMLYSLGSSDFTAGDEIEDTLETALLPISASETLLYLDASLPRIVSVSAEPTGELGEVAVTVALDGECAAASSVEIEYGDDGIAQAVALGGGVFRALVGGLECGSDFSCTAVARAANGGADAVKARTVHVPGDPVFAYATVSVAPATNAIFMAQLSHLGPGTTTVELWTAVDGAQLAPVDGARWTFSEQDGEPQNIVFERVFDWDKDVYWTFVATAVKDGTGFDSSTDIAYFNTYDVATYYWAAGETPGDWFDPSNWSANMSGYRGYPGLHSKAVMHTDTGEHFCIRIPRSLKCEEIWFDNWGATIELVSTAAGGVYFDAVQIGNNLLSGETLILDDVRTWAYGYHPKDGAKIVFKGAHAGLDIHNSARLTEGDVVMDFLVPADGYASTPVVSYKSIGVTGAALVALEDDSSTMVGRFIVNVPADAPIAGCGGKARVKLVDAAIDAEQMPYIAAGTVPNGECSLDIEPDGIYFNYSRYGMIVIVR
ncbi:MAG: LamG domain-containing protein [Kiritimatiellae bacterium]|nr:LamG domain-containing protein [Kiritimatiellia bacterium]